MSVLALVVAAVAGALVAAVVVSILARRAREVEVHRSGRELQAARAEAESAEARLDAILDGLPLALLVFRPDGTLRHANEAGRRYGHARPGDALVSAAIRELVTTALQAVAPPPPQPPPRTGRPSPPHDRSGGRPARRRIG